MLDNIGKDAKTGRQSTYLWATDPSSCRESWAQVGLLTTCSVVAIKKIKTSAAWKDGIDMSALREIKFLRELSHPNVITVSWFYSSPRVLV